jgi:hypothetical protein
LCEECHTSGKLWNIYKMNQNSIVDTRHEPSICCRVIRDGRRPSFGQISGSNNILLNYTYMNLQSYIYIYDIKTSRHPPTYILLDVTNSLDSASLIKFLEKWLLKLRKNMANRSVISPWQVTRIGNFLN